MTSDLIKCKNSDVRRHIKKESKEGEEETDNEIEDKEEEGQGGGGKGLTVDDE